MPRRLPCSLMLTLLGLSTLPALAQDVTVTLDPVTRTRHVEPDQALKLKPAKEPSEEDMISIIPQSA